MAEWSRNDDELSLRAFRYIAGELSDADAAAFERRLTRDLAGCEAVAEMVEITGAIALIQAAPVGATTSRRWPAAFPTRFRMRLATAVAASIATGVFCLATASSSPRLGPPDRAEGMEDAPRSVALAWSSLRQKYDAALFAELGDWPLFEPPASSLTRTALDPREDDAALPSWVLASIDASEEPGEDGAGGN